MPVLPPDPLLDGYRKFRASEYPAQRSLYAELAKGQQPHTLVIACSDSRVDPTRIFAAAPGSLFVVRNVANLVPPADDDGGRHGVSAALEFAVGTLKVEQILVMGHGQCGGIAASAQGIDPTESTYLGPWLEPVEPARAEVVAEVGEGDLDVMCDRLELNSIRHSVARLRQFPFVEQAISERGLQIHGARFSIETGLLEWMDEGGEFQPVDV